MEWRLKWPASPLFTQPFNHARSEKTSTLRATGLCVGNSPVAGKFSAQMVSNAENVAIWWRHHDWVIAELAVVNGKSVKYKKSYPDSKVHRELWHDYRELWHNDLFLVTSNDSVNPIQEHDDWMKYVERNQRDSGALETCWRSDQRQQWTEK